MCLKPRLVPNYYYSHKAYCQEHGDLKEINRNLVPTDEYLTVDCGECAECRAKRTSSIFQRALVESLTSYLFFVTLTYDNKHIPILRIGDRVFKYSDYNHIQLMFKRFRDSGLLDRDFRYIVCSEYGTKKHRPHFHIALFVSKKQGDNEGTPYLLEGIIKENLGNYFAINVGTRKHPIYEKLFTPRSRYVNGKLKTNYFVKLVEGNSIRNNIFNEFDNFVQRDEYVHSIRYIIGYVSKGSEFDESIMKYLDTINDTDKILYRKLRGILKSQLRYSKGFGSGFQSDGTKYYLNRISVRCSSNLHVYTEICNNLPATYDEFVDLYPSLNDELIVWRDRDYYKYFSTWKRCLNSMDSEQYMYHCIYLKYFLKEFQERYGRFKRGLLPLISNIFGNLHYCKYQPSKIQTYEADNSPLFTYLRQMVDESIDKKLPIISFRIDCERRYVPMCKYYRERVCTIDDTYNLFNALGVKNFNEWIKLFEKTLNNRQVVEYAGNDYKFFNNDFIDDDELEISDDDILYNKIFKK